MDTDHESNLFTPKKEDQDSKEVKDLKDEIDLKKITTLEELRDAINLGIVISK